MLSAGPLLSCALGLSVGQLGRQRGACSCPGQLGFYPRRGGRWLRRREASPPGLSSVPGAVSWKEGARPCRAALAVLCSSPGLLPPMSTSPFCQGMKAALPAPVSSRQLSVFAVRWSRFWKAKRAACSMPASGVSSCFLPKKTCRTWTHPCIPR